MSPLRSLNKPTPENEQTDTDRILFYLRTAGVVFWWVWPRLGRGNRYATDCGFWQLHYGNATGGQTGLSRAAATFVGKSKSAKYRVQCRYGRQPYRFPC